MPSANVVAGDVLSYVVFVADTGPQRGECANIVTRRGRYRAAGLKYVGLKNGKCAGGAGISA